MLRMMYLFVTVDGNCGDNGGGHDGKEQKHKCANWQNANLWRCVEGYVWGFTCDILLCVNDINKSFNISLNTTIYLLNNILCNIF